MLPFYDVLDRGDNLQIVNKDRWVSLSESAISTIGSYLQNRDNKMKQLQRETSSLYDKAVSLFEITSIKFRDWEEIKLGSLVCFGWPILLPYTVIQSKKSKGSNEGALGILFSPVFLPHIIKKLVYPSEKGFKIKNRIMISKKKRNKCYFDV